MQRLQKLAGLTSLPEKYALIVISGTIHAKPPAAPAPLAGTVGVVQTGQDNILLLY